MELINIVAALSAIMLFEAECEPLALDPVIILVRLLICLSVYSISMLCSLNGRSLHRKNGTKPSDQSSVEHQLDAHAL